MCHNWCICVLFYFFFSSRRRHTRCLSDWSSDVCSSDLTDPLTIGGDPQFGQRWAGRIDEVRIYNRALAASELQYDMAAPGICGIGAGSFRFAADKQTVSWSNSVGSGPFDVAKGDLASLRSSGGSFASATCFDNNETTTIAADPAQPSPGQGSYYLMRCDGGTWSDGTQLGTRETTLAACP